MIRKRAQRRSRPNKRVRTAGQSIAGTNIVMYKQPAARNYRTGGFLDLETKYIDTNYDANAFATSWATMEDATADAISCVAQGDGESNRDGRVYTIKSIHVRGFMYLTTSEAATDPQAGAVCRIALVWDKQTNGAQLTPADVFNNGTNSCNQFRDLQYVRRFKVLKDITRTIIPDNMNEAALNSFAFGTKQVPFQMHVKFPKGIKVRCSTTTATIAAVVDNSLHIIGVSTTTSAFLSYTSRLRFWA